MEMDWSRNEDNGITRIYLKIYTLRIICFHGVVFITFLFL